MSQHDSGKCTTRLIVNWLGVIALLALGAAVGLCVYTSNDATTIVTIVGITASVASGLIGYLGGRGAQQSLNTGPVDKMTVEGSPTVKTEPDVEAAPTEEDPAVTRGGGAG